MGAWRLHVGNPTRLQIMIEDTTYVLRLRACGQRAVLEEPLLSPQPGMFRREDPSMPVWGCVWDWTRDRDINVCVKFFSDGHLTTSHGQLGTWQLHPADPRRIDVSFASVSLKFHVLILHLDHDGRCALVEEPSSQRSRMLRRDQEEMVECNVILDTTC